MSVWSALAPVRMRTPDPFEPELHVLEEVAKPAAAVNGSRITVWVYRQGVAINEIVLSGHAEPSTCSRATTALIENAKALDANADWMLTAGAAHFRVERDTNQEPLARMVFALKQIEADTGLVHVIERHWSDLYAFRGEFELAARAAPPMLIRPHPSIHGGLATFVPIVPHRAPNGPPLVFEFEGWDFDGPEFQAVAECHLRSMQRELLGDALRRRRAYRVWLKDWTEDWIGELGTLRRRVADETAVPVPSSPHPRGPASRANPLTFLREELGRFLDRGQTWPFLLAHVYGRMTFGQFSDAKLDEERRPTSIKEVDWERCEIRTRPARPDDKGFTWRERVTAHTPMMIRSALEHILMMNEIIRPYEQVLHRGAGSRADGKEDADARMLSDVSRQVIMETGLRGWPSFYLEHARDRDAFNRWTKKRRAHLWRIMTRQAKKAGVDPEILLEDNIIYRIRFDEDLRCFAQPLMLIDTSAHLQVHGSRLGASAALPIWTRRTPTQMEPKVMALGQTNTERARRLVAEAAQLAQEPLPDIDTAVEHLRCALACHAGAGGRFILEEWARRLGRDTRELFARARLIVEAAELCARGRYEAARPLVHEYLAIEANPVDDAYVIDALADLIGGTPTLEQVVQKQDEWKALLSRHEALREQLEREFQTAIAEGKVPDRSGADQLNELASRVMMLDKEIKDLEQVVTNEARLRARIIDDVLVSRGDARARYPLVARAWAVATDALRAVRESEDCAYRPSDEYGRRYGSVRGVFEVRGLFEISHLLGAIHHEVGEHLDDGRHKASAMLPRVLAHPWLPDVLSADLRLIAEDCDKGAWDRLQASRIQAMLQDAAGICVQRMRDVSGDRHLKSDTLAESLLLRVHVIQRVEHNYRQALEMLLNADVAFGRAVSSPWTIASTLAELPSDATLRVEHQGDATSIVSSRQDESTTLLWTRGLAADERAYVETLIADPKTRASIPAYASSLAEGLLIVNVRPCPRWLIWVEAMRRVPNELLFALSLFGYQATLAPDCLPPLSEAGKKAHEARDRRPPMLKPDVDWFGERAHQWPSLSDLAATSATVGIR